LKAAFSLSIECRDEATAKKLHDVLAPDNRAFPKTQRFSFARKGRILLFKVESDRLLSLLSTLESVLSDVGLFQDVSMTSISMIN
jgi:tRNA threonylcarbamoyladenosine modification (KEOPS) complex  Pcc1 subunit